MGTKIVKLKKTWEISTKLTLYLQWLISESSNFASNSNFTSIFQALLKIHSLFVFPISSTSLSFPESMLSKLGYNFKTSG